MTYRAYGDAAYGESFLSWAIRRGRYLVAPRPLDLLYFDDADEPLLAACGATGLRARGHWLAGLADYSRAFPAAATLVLTPAATLTARAAIGRLLASECPARALRTGRATLFRAGVLEELGRIDAPGTHPFDALRELERWRGAAGLAVDLDPPTEPELRCESKADAWRLARITALPADREEGEYLAAWRGAPEFVPPAVEAMPRDARPRILYVTPAGGYSGAEASLCQLAAGLDPAEFDRHAVTGAEGVFSRKLEAAGCRVQPANFAFSAPHPAAFPWAAATLDRLSPAVVHANSNLGQPWLEALRERGQPWIQHVRNGHFDLLRPALEEATAIIAISDWVRGRLLASGLDPARVNRIWNGVDLEHYDPARCDRGRLRAQLGWPADHLVALMVARCSRQKRFELLLAAAATLGRPIHVALVTDREDAPYRAELEHQARALRLRVEWIDFQADLRPWQAAADITVLPSEGEAFGRCLIESLALGVPVIAGDDAGPREVVEPGVTGEVFAAGSAEALAAALDRLQRAEPEQWAAMRQAARSAAARQWDARSTARATAALYHRILAQ